jgi:hypothetical protein
MKLIYHNETKRVQNPTSFKHLLQLSSEAFDLQLLNVIKFYYVDQDGDIITISG